jgi:hypothetical protein
VNGQKINVDVTQDGTGLEIALDDTYKLPAGINDVSLLDSKEHFLLWREQRALARFEIPYKKSHAVLIAIDDYNPKEITRSSSLRPLGRMVAGLERPVDGMVDQAERLAKVLRSLGFEIVRLYNKDATRQNIEAALMKYWPQGEYEDVDRLFFYYGGHGLAQKDASGESQSLLATYDYDLAKIAASTFHTNDLKGRHARNIAANHVMFALDVCHSGLVTVTMGDPHPQLSPSESRLALVAAEIRKKARNFLVAGTTDEPALFDHGGIFTAKLIEALEGEADEDKDGLLTFTEISRWVKKSVIKTVVAKFPGSRQEPDWDYLNFIGKGDTLFFPAASLRSAGKEEQPPIASPTAGR